MASKGAGEETSERSVEGAIFLTPMKTFLKLENLTAGQILVGKVNDSQESCAALREHWDVAHGQLWWKVSWVSQVQVCHVSPSVCGVQECKLA